MQSIVVREQLKTGLDIGCNENSPLTSLRGTGFRSTGLDAYLPALEVARWKGLHDEYLCCDVRQLPDDCAFDVVVASHVIEHLTRDDGFELLRKIEKLARRLIYIETPLGFVEQGALNGNPFQRHLSGWFPMDFESRGYTVFGLGSRRLRRRGSAAGVLPEPLVRAAERSVQWFSFRYPSCAHSIAGIRFADENGDLRAL
jgi:SAM-dependent methyltransferase